MSKERELLKEALKVLEWNGIMGSHDTYNSIKELLAQPEQEQEIYAKGYAEAMQQLVYEAYESGRKSALTEQEPVAWMWEFAVRSSWDASFTGEWKEEISRSKPITDGIVKGFNPTKLERTVRNLIPLYKAHGIGGGE
jgi:cation transport regulator ChaB